MDPLTVGVVTLAAGATIAMIMAWKRQQGAGRVLPTASKTGPGATWQPGQPLPPAGPTRFVVNRGRFGRGFEPGRVTLDGRVVPHRGIDITAVEGEPVHAVKPGTVREAGPISGYGQTVIVEHDGGGASLYGHLSRIDVAAGRRVNAQDVIGLVGRTSAGPDGVVPDWGRTMGAHLHMEIHRSYPPQLPMGAAGGTVVDPVAWLRNERIDMYQARS